MAPMHPRFRAEEVGTSPHRFTTTDLILAATFGLAAGIWTAYLITVAADRVFG